MVVKDQTKNCGQCNGAMNFDSDMEEMVCVNCGRRKPAPATRVAGDVTITVELHPSNLKELIGALGMMNGITGTEYLQRLGLPKGQANKMVSGAVIYPKTLVALTRATGITPQDIWTLMERGEQQSSSNGAGSRPGPKPKEGKS